MLSRNAVSQSIWSHSRSQRRAQINELKLRERIVALVHLAFRFGYDYLECWAHVRFEQMASVCGTICLADHKVSMNLGSSILQCYIADKRKHLNLFIQPDANVLFLLPIEVSERDIPQSAYRSEVARTKLLLFGEHLQTGCNFVPGLEDQGDCLWRVR